MQSVKCASCGLTNFVSDTICKRCKNPLSAPVSAKSSNRISTVCPKCDSDSTQSFKMAYETGTSHGRVRMAGITESGEIGLAGGGVSSQSVLARSVRPPAKIDGTFFAIVGVVLVVAVFFLSAYIALVLGLGFWSILVGLVGAAGAGLIVNQSAGQTIKKADAEYENAIFRWTRSWICLRCGNSWLIR
jgi:hypothetical protein